MMRCENDQKQLNCFNEFPQHGTGKYRRELSGFSLIEIVTAILIIGVALAGSVSVYFVAVRATRVDGIKLRAASIARDLMEEITAKDFQDPVDPAPVFGPESPGGVLETRFGSAIAAAFNDVDDYNNWQAAPPQIPHPDPAIGGAVVLNGGDVFGSGGTLLYTAPDYAQFRQRVVVQYANATTLQPAGVGTPTAYKLIQVFIDYSATGNFAAPEYTYGLDQVVSDHR